MHDINKKPLEVGCILKSIRDWFHRVDFVGKERFITAGKYKTLEEAENTECSGYPWTQEEINKYEFKIVAYRKLETPDNKGNVVRVHDWVKFEGGEYEVIGELRALKGNRHSFVVKDDFWSNGWSSVYASDCTLVKPPKQVEVSLDEIAKWKGCRVEDVRVKE